MPRVSFVSALGIISEIIGIHRFATADKLASYTRLAPSHRDNADVYRTVQ